MNRDGFEYDDVSSIREYLDELVVCGELNSTPLPSPELIWWRAQLAEKRDLARRSVLAIDAVRSASVIVAAVLALLIALLWAPRLFAGVPLPLPLILSALLVFAGSTGGVLLVWARQR